jgi:hypothetical protein
MRIPIPIFSKPLSVDVWYSMYIFKQIHLVTTARKYGSIRELKQIIQTHI